MVYFAYVLYSTVLEGEYIVYVYILYRADRTVPSSPTAHPASLILYRIHMTKATPPRMIAIGNPQPTVYPAILNHTALYIAPTLIPATHPRHPNAPYLTTQPDKTSSWLPWWVLGCGALPSAAPSSTNKGARLGMGDSRRGGRCLVHVDVIRMEMGIWGFR